MSTPVRPLSFHDTGRQSPFRRQNSASPATVRAATPTSSPTKAPLGLSPTKAGSLSPEKTSPFVRRPSQINHASERPSSPFARPTSSLSIPASPSRHVSNSSTLSKHEDTSESPRPLPSPTRRTSPPTAIEADERPPPSSPAFASPSPFDGPPLDSLLQTLPSQASLRPTAPRTTTSSTISTIKAAPIFNPAPNSHKQHTPQPPTTTTTTRRLNPTNMGMGIGMGMGGGNSSNGGYTHVPAPLLRSMRESFEVLDSTNTGSLTPTSLTTMLEQMALPTDPSTLRSFFPPTNNNNPSQQLNLARYLDTLSAPLASLSHPDELAAAFEAFDVDDSGQIDLAEIRRAVLHTAPEPGEDMVRLSEREVDGILGEFSSRRAFGAKGMHVAKGKGEVFRWREFMAGMQGGSASDVDAGVGEGGVAA